jgi:hypothetical protein
MKGSHIVASAILLLASVQSSAAANQQSDMITKHPVTETIQGSRCLREARSQTGWRCSLAVRDSSQDANCAMGTGGESVLVKEPG